MTTAQTHTRMGWSFGRLPGIEPEVLSTLVHCVPKDTKTSGRRLECLFARNSSQTYTAPLRFPDVNEEIHSLSRPYAKIPKKGILLQGAVVEDVRTIFEKKNDMSIYIPSLLPIT